MSSNRISFDFQPTNKFDAAQKPASKEPSVLQMEVPKQDEYLVKRGDTLTEIAVKTGQNLQELLKKNPQIKNPNKIQIGERIEIGKSSNIYTVKPGDTLSEIAKAKHTTVGDLMRANPGQIGNRNLIYPGQKLIITAKGGIITPPEKAAPQADKPKQPVSSKPTEPTLPQVENKPKIEQPNVNNQQSKNVTTGNLKIAQIDLDDFLSPEKGSNAGFAILIGNAEGNRTAEGGFVKPNYYGHKDPGDGLWNIGSFSRANARFPNLPPARSPEEADKMHLQHIQKAKAKYVDTMKKAGLDPNNALLASVYFDAFNQSERAAGKMLAPENLDYLKGKELSLETMKQWRVGGFINLQTGQRWKNASGSPVGGGLAKIANRATMKKYGRPATEQEIQQVIRRDQSRRVNEMIEPMKKVGLLPVENAPNIKPSTTDRPDSATASPTAATGSKVTSTRYYRARAGVILNENAKNKLSAIGQEYQRKTGGTIEITSGTRTPYRQAGAMFAKIQLRDNFSDYTNRQALSEILTTYRQAKAAGKSDGQIKQAMAETIQNQVNRHSYISRHLQGGAADVSLNGLNQKAFRESVRSVTGQEPLYEGKPAHFHLQF
ncbi:MAG: LysM peptidoglycan-binding domain-containing protein [Acidobacteriota bacterium]|nr:LysM peptidoglycan-binding domain-containing protein [Acidobacteriota bacterium]